MTFDSKAYHKKYYLLHRDELLNKAKERDKDPIKLERKRLLSREGYKKRYINLFTTGELIYKRMFYNRNSIKRSAYNKELVDYDTFKEWYINTPKICYYCKTPLNSDKYNTKESLSIDRKDNNRGYIIENIALSCDNCNSIKSDYFTEKEMILLGDTIKKIKEERLKHNTIIITE